MKKTILSFALLASSFIGFSQNTDDFKKFDIGPFEVIDQDHNYRLRDGVNIPEYFELKTPMKKNSFQVDLFTSLPGVGSAWTYGVDFIWKRKISDCWFLNLGLESAVPKAKYGNIYEEKTVQDGEDVYTMKQVDNFTITSCYFGIPVTLEYVFGKNSLASGFLGFGVTPAWYHLGGLKADVKDKYDLDVKNFDKRGCYVAPRVEVGLYVPAGKYHIRAGLSAEYRIDVTDRNVKARFSKCIGDFVPGVNLGLVF